MQEFHHRHNKEIGFVYAVVSGMMAACSGAFAKYASLFSDGSSWKYVAATIVCNLLMTNAIAKAYARVPSAVALILNTSANLMTSAMIGRIVFAESVSWIWWIGTFFIIVGISILCSEQQSQEEEKTNLLKHNVKKYE